ncbi:alpha-glucan family phosphorylase [Dictyoglomus sp.]|uniref:alpha-glucan family phosphorylase n=1 Tax=Dictyoglomus sp. TaxID=28205 RepID=UPI003D12AFF7
MREDYLEKLRKEEVIAYFSMEIALISDIPTYSGGLGVLAGDTVRTAADLNIPFIAITQLSRKGYFKQEIDKDGNQIEYPVNWDPEKFLTKLPFKTNVEIEGRNVSIQPWVYYWTSLHGHTVPVIFLDTNLPENSEEDKNITDVLYGGDLAHRLKQEIILGIGGAKVIKQLGLRVRKYHLNEGHSSLLTLELLKDELSSGKSLEEAEKNVKEKCVFTTHTPVEAGHDKFPYDMVTKIMGNYISIDIIKKFAGNDILNMTLLALNLSGYVNGVAKRHQEISLQMFPGHRIHAITNGVHSFTWTSPSFRKLFDKYIPGWATEPELLSRAQFIPNEEIWNAHMEAKRDLIKLISNETGVQFDENVLTIGFARRATAYKRPHLLFSDINRLKKVKRKGPIQIVYAGKAHPKDIEGKKLIKEIYEYIKALENNIKIVYLQDYNLDMAKKIIAGVDVWLNTPQRPLEASGTSGMKAAHNGVINFSVLDGWWIEGHVEGYTGWSIGPSPFEEKSIENHVQEEIDDLYNKLEYIIIPTYYHHRDEWIEIMKNSISNLASYFNTHRMMKRYITEAYFKIG